LTKELTRKYRNEGIIELKGGINSLIKKRKEKEAIRKHGMLCPCGSITAVGIGE